MAAKMVSVVPFERLASGDLSRVLRAQREEWLRRLDWDLTEISELIEESIESRMIAGSALVIDGEPCGYGFFVPEAARVLIGEIYLVPGARTPVTSDALVGELLSKIAAEHPRKRVESQSVHFDPRGLEAAFSRYEFERAGRTYMRAETTDAQAGSHPRVEIRSWRDGDYDRAVEVIYQAYRGGVDARANSGYRTREGCADLMDALVSSAWCGTFDEELTQVAVDRESGRVAAVAIASTISDVAGHLGQISVLPDYQGAGVGRALVSRALSVARGAGFGALTLAVTDENAAAKHLYERSGFRPALEFPVFYRDARGR